MAVVAPSLLSFLFITVGHQMFLLTMSTALGKLRYLCTDLDCIGALELRDNVIMVFMLGCFVVFTLTWLVSAMYTFADLSPLRSILGDNTEKTLRYIIDGGVGVSTFMGAIGVFVHTGLMTWDLVSTLTFFSYLSALTVGALGEVTLFLK